MSSKKSPKHSGHLVQKVLSEQGFHPMVLKIVLRKPSQYITDRLNNTSQFTLADLVKIADFVGYEVTDFIM